MLVSFKSYLATRRPARGDTIIEVLLSVSILGLVLALSFTSSSRSLNAGTSAANRNEAVSYAQEQVEYLRLAANNNTISNYPTDGTKFCIDPSTGVKTLPAKDGFCHLSSEGTFGVAVAYNGSNQTYNVTSDWPTAAGTSQVQLYYQVPTDPIANSPDLSIIITPTPPSIPYNGSTTINWSTDKAASCTASGGWSGDKSVAPGTHSQTFNNLTGTTTYKLTCKGQDGVSTLTKSATVYVSQLTPPDVIFNAAPKSVSYNSTSRLTWSTVNATSCTASGGWSGSESIRGTQAVGPLTSTTTYSLQCFRSDGITSQTANATITVAPPPNPTVSISAAPPSIAYNGSSMLTWSSTNATSCTASGGWSGAKATSNSQSTGNLTTSQTFTITCSGISGTAPASDSVAVYVSAPPPPPRPGSCNSSSVSVGGTYRVGGNSVHLVASAGGCSYYSNNYVGWNGGGAWDAQEAPGYTFCQNGGVDPWGFYAQSCTWI